MTRPRHNDRQRKIAQGRRTSALGRIELRQPTEPNRKAAGVTSLAIKEVDPATRAAIDAFLARRKPT